MPEQPALMRREAQTYVALATAVTMEGFRVVESLTEEVFAWMEQHGVVRAGAPFVRFVTTDMSAELDIEVGVPVDSATSGDERFLVGSIPAGTYVTLFYGAKDDHDHYQANVEVQEWAAHEGLAWDIERSSGVDVWTGRCEFIRPDLSSDDGEVFELIYKVIDPAD
jgi:effector-binding domain-containing protein